MGARAVRGTSTPVKGRGVTFGFPQLGCCGLMSAEDWLATGYYKGSQHFPKSCCSTPNVACTAENLTLRAEVRDGPPCVLRFDGFLSFGDCLVGV